MLNALINRFHVRAGGVFRIRWERMVEVSFNMTGHLHNRLNENKPVKISRDGQEVPADVGAQLCQLFEQVGQQRGDIR